MAQQRPRGSEPHAAPVPVYLEQGARRTFAVAVDWPGWARAGRGDEAALDTLAEYLPRYVTALRAAGLEPPVTGPDGPQFTVVERVPGNATTDFGAPGVVPALDADGWDAPDADRQTALIEACWARMDDAAAHAPAVLRKGPRRGGRDRDAIVEHVLNAELAYARKIGVRVSPPTDPDAVRAYREQVLSVLRASASADAPAEAATGRPKRWPLPYAARRIAWHALDHAWEVEDRSDPAG